MRKLSYPYQHPISSREKRQGNACSATDYYPFGFPMPNRTKYPEKYRFGFNGQEADNEIFGDKQSYTAEFWQYDTRIARRWNIDPVQHPWESPYSVFGESPLIKIDPNGALDTWYTDKNGNVLLYTNDGSDAIVTIPENLENDFKTYAEMYKSNKGMRPIFDSPAWNDYWRSELGLAKNQLSPGQINILGMLNSDWSRKNAIEYWLNPTGVNFFAASVSETL